MLRVRYSQEASNYLFDNGELTRELAIAIESLVFSDGRPDQGEVTIVSPGLLTWLYLEHIVVYRILEGNLNVIVVMPVN